MNEKLTVQRQIIRVIYPGAGGQIALRIDSDWERDIEALFLSAVQDERHTVIPRGEMGEQRGDRPAVVGGAGQILVGKVVDQRFQPAARIGVLLCIREAHVCLLKVDFCSRAGSMSGRMFDGWNFYDDACPLARL